MSKRFTIIAGPNGAGKTTFVTKIFPELLNNHHFVNADLLAQEMHPQDVSKVEISAGKLFIAEVDKLIKDNGSFMIETTLSGMGLLKKIDAAKKQGFLVNLIFLWVPHSWLCDFRVKGRVALGGHNIPIEDIIRRYKRGLANFPKFLQIADECQVYLANEMPVLIFEKANKTENIINSDLYSSFKKLYSPGFNI